MYEKMASFFPRSFLSQATVRGPGQILTLGAIKRKGKSHRRPRTRFRRTLAKGLSSKRGELTFLTRIESATPKESPVQYTRTVLVHAESWGAKFRDPTESTYRRCHRDLLKLFFLSELLPQSRIRMVQGETREQEQRLSAKQNAT